MVIDKKTLKEIIGKLVVTKEGKRLGNVKDITFETRTGELLQIILKDPTIYTKSLKTWNIIAVFISKKSAWSGLTLLKI